MRLRLKSNPTRTLGNEVESDINFTKATKK